MSAVISAATIETLVSKLAPALIEPVKGAAITAKDKIEVKFKRGFSAYIADQVERYSTVKTIISSSTPLELRKIYVNLHLLNNSIGALRDDDLLQKIEGLKFVLFTATAGSGKSMLMRYLYLHFLESQNDRLPIFINLRDLNNLKDSTILDLLALKIADHIPKFNKNQVEYALRSGRVVLFMDGFDEIDHDKRSIREIEINEIAGKFKNLRMFVSSRPAETFANWSLFHVLDVQPFSRRQVELLLDKIDFDTEMRDLFRAKLVEGLYDTHREFLTNPLLVVMMLLTLSEFAEIPAKIHLFYERAFDALYGKHDATKEGRFERKRYTSLAIDDFKRLFSYFCTITYTKKQIGFTSSELIKNISNSIKASQIDEKPELFKRDLVESTCLLISDGLDFVFSHRSFQEYFVAYFISRVKVTNFDTFRELLSTQAMFDNVLPMLSEMSKEKFEEGWALPRLREILDRVQGIDASTHPYEYSCALFGKKYISGVIHKNGFELILNRDKESIDDKDYEKYKYITDVRSSLYRVYEVFEKAHITNIATQKIGKDVVEKLGRNLICKGDERFADFRASFSDEKDQNRYRIELQGSDNDWIKSTSFGYFISKEAEIVPKLKEEIERRVRKREAAMKEILSVSFD